MKIQDLYEKYKIMPFLQMHMLRVAGVALIVSDNFQIPLNRKLIASACLLHDMGNVVKFRFDIFDNWFKPLGKKYWKLVQQEFIRKYGTNDHEATTNILNEIGVSGKTIHLIENIGYSESEKINKSSDYNLKIISYADQRVSPYSVVSIVERYKEAENRYVGTIHDKYSPGQFEYLKMQNFDTEKQVFNFCKIKPEYITEKRVLPLISELRYFDISVS